MYRTTLAFEPLLPDEPVALDLSHLYTQFHTLRDQRARRCVRYPLPLLLMVALLAKLTGHTQVRALAQWAALRAHELAHLDLAGIVVTGDAMYTQRPLSTQIVEAGGDYLWAGTLWVKDNQLELRQDIEQLFEPEPNEFGTAALPTDFTTARTLEKGHGCIEERVLATSSMLQDYSTWPYVAQVFKLESTVTTARRTHTTVRYGVTSIPHSVADAARWHWYAGIGGSRTACTTAAM